MIKQVIIMRTDLNMRKGKMIAQGAHASQKVFFDRMWNPKWESEEECELCNWETDCKMQNWSKRTPEEDKDVYPNSNPCLAYKTNIFYTNYSQKMIEWKNGSFAKIVVGCNSEEELHKLKRQADEAGIVNAIILDNGNTEFKKYKCPNCGTYNVGDYFGVDTFNTANLKPIKGFICMEKGCQTIIKKEDIVIENKPTYTCLAIGPDEAEKIDIITKELKLL